MVKKIENIGSCIFCGKSRFKKNPYSAGKIAQWKSYIQIMIDDAPIRLTPFVEFPSRGTVTVCPNCRDCHTVMDLYKKSVEKLSESYKEELDKMAESVKIRQKE